MTFSIDSNFLVLYLVLWDPGKSPCQWEEGKSPQAGKGFLSEFRGIRIPARDDTVALFSICPLWRERAESCGWIERFLDTFSFITLRFHEMFGFLEFFEYGWFKDSVCYKMEDFLMMTIQFYLFFIVIITWFYYSTQTGLYRLNTDFFVCWVWNLKVHLNLLFSYYCTKSCYLFHVLNGEVFVLVDIMRYDLLLFKSSGFQLRLVMSKIEPAWPDLFDSMFRLGWFLLF